MPIQFQGIARKHMDDPHPSRFPVSRSPSLQLPDKPAVSLDSHNRPDPSSQPLSQAPLAGPDLEYQVLLLGTP